MDIVNFIEPKFAVVVVCLWVCGLAIKKIKQIPDNYIPVILTILSIVLVCSIAQTIDGITIVQGILCASASIYGNQLVKQTLDKTETK